MELSLHKVTAIKVNAVQKLYRSHDGGAFYTQDILIETDKGNFTVTTFAASPVEITVE